MQVEVRLFAYLRQLLNKGSEPFQVELLKERTIKDLIVHLSLEKEPSLIIMVNGRRQTDDYVLSDKDRVGIFPPVGGG